MSFRLVKRLLSEPDKRLLWKFVYNFGFQGMRAVQRFDKRLKNNEHFPAFMFISVTNACNLSCQGCWVNTDHPGPEMAPETLNNLIEVCKKKGSRFFGILGGEPLLYKPLFEVLEKHPECYFVLFTNGTLIDESAAKRMNKLGNISPLISIEGLEEVSDVRRGGQNVYARSLQGLDHCSKQGLVCGVATSVCKSNIDDLATETFINELTNRGVHYLWYYIYRPVGPRPTPELALSEDQVVQLRKFIVDSRKKAALVVVDAYWDADGKAMCPAAVGMAHHINPSGDVEPCPPLQFSCDNVGDGSQLAEIVGQSEFLERFRKKSVATTPGCIIVEDPAGVVEFMSAEGARDSSGRNTVYEEYAAMCPCCSHHVPGREIPERGWAFRFAKKNWFFGFGAYG